MKKLREIERMHPAKRRRFLKWLGLGLAGSAVAPELRFGCLELAGGPAHAKADAASKPTYLIEICLRDQWDQGHVMVAPSLASALDSFSKGPTGGSVALYASKAELTYSAPHRAYLTSDSTALKPHLDHIAMIDVCNHSVGVTHGHEAANPIRSPGRTYDSHGGAPMWLYDPVANSTLLGCEAYYSRTPTPSSLHNHVQRALKPELRSGIAFKGISRSGFTAYHFSAGLDGGELDRVRSKDQLFKKFPHMVDDVNVVATRDEAEAFAALLGRMDRRYLDQSRFSEAAVENHVGNVRRTTDQFYVREPKVVSLPLTPEEEAYWGAGVPAQQCTQNDTEIFTCSGSSLKAQIWEQAAYAHKLLASGLTRTVALEFDFRDLHNYRPEASLRTMGKQISMSLARLIEKLKATDSPDYAGKLFERTLIAVYTTDGSRSPIADSYGDTPQAKNTLILAGGMIKGGYYGDIVPGGFGFLSRAPDPNTGALHDAGSRVSDADAWRTVMHALEVPGSKVDDFPAVRGGRPLKFLLRNA